VSGVEVGRSGAKTSAVMPGFMPGIHVFLLLRQPKTWMPATSAGMTIV
jgi:hypothetical protein